MTAQPSDHPFEVTLARSGGIYQIAPGRSVLEVLRAAGVPVEASCESGSCGTCIVPLLEGEADHRDIVLTAREKSSLFVTCVSRALGSHLVLDL